MTDTSVPLTPDTTSHTAEEATRAMAAPVLGALWMLGRQWQTAELHAEDCGAAVGLELTLDTAALELTTPTGSIEPTQPLQAVVDAEPLPALATRPIDELAAAGIELLRTLDDHGAGDARETFVGARYRLAIGDDEWALLEPASQRRLRPLRNRIPDPRPIVADVEPALGPTGAGTGPLPELPGLPANLSVTARTGLEAALRDWIRWLDPVPVNPPSGAYWTPERLESTFALTASTNSANVRLQAPEHLGGDLDWYSFARSQEPTTSTPALPQQQLLPAPITYPGMPLPRHWQLEAGNVNLDVLPIRSDDIGALALLAFVHQQANDWFSVPVELPTGSVTFIHSLTVVTSFGERIAIPAAAGQEDADAAWQLFTISPYEDAPTARLKGASPLVLAHAAGRHLTGPVIEDVLLLRDEMANLAWAVERLTRDPSGQPIDRFTRYQRLRPPSSAADPQASPYRLGSTVPDNWYPLQSATDTLGRPTLQLSSIPGNAIEVPDTGVRGTILDHREGSAIRDEEAPREGAHVTRRWHSARWTDGVTHTWRARAKGPGLGEGSSGLRFDYLDQPYRTGAPPPVPPPNLVRNPHFANARPVPPGPLRGSGVPGESAAEDWTLWNNLDATTSTSLEPTTRAGGRGQMLHITTTASSCGLVQQWAPSDTGPDAAVASAWVYVIRGTVIMGCGDGGNIGVDATSTSQGRWEFLEATNGRSPVNELIIYASDPEGAEYLVDHVSVRPGTAPPQPQG